MTNRNLKFIKKGYSYVYGTDDCGSPVCVRIQNNVIDRIKVLQIMLQAMPLKDNEHGEFNIGFETEMLGITSHQNHWWFSINKDAVWINMMGYECEENICGCEDLDFENLPEIYFSDWFLYKHTEAKKDSTLYDKNQMNKAYDLMPPYHKIALKKAVKARKIREKKINET